MIAENRPVPEDFAPPAIHPLTLSFGGPLEREFLDDYRRKSRGHIRFTILISALFYAVFGLLDAAVAPAALKTLWLIRFGIFLPICGLVFGLTYTAVFRRFWQLILGLWGLAAGLGIVAMIGVVQGEALNSYFAGLIMVFIVLYTWIRVRFVWASAVGWLVVAAFEILTVGLLRLPPRIVLTQNFFFIGSTILGMFACYSMERYARMDFVMARLLKEEREKVRMANLRLAAANEELTALAHLDDLTGIPNRRMFEQDLNRGWRRMAREGKSLALIICDVDCFKSFNDDRGHLAGDECLVRVARAVAGAARRPGDYGARYGGDEFAAILLDTSLKGAIRVAEGICRAVRELEIPHAASDVADHVTVSVGVAALVPTPERGPEFLVGKADEYLYQAKARGRDRVASAEDR